MAANNRHRIHPGLALLAAEILIIASVPVPALPFAIGHTTITFEDPERGNRPILTEIHYPADAPGENVPLADPPSLRFPSIAFGHGYLMVVGAYENVVAALVPEGYILAIPATEGGLLPNHLNFGRDLAYVIGALRSESASNPSSLFFGRVAETSAVMGHSMGGGASFLGALEDPGITAVANLAAAETSPSAIGAASEITIPAFLLSGSLDCVTPPSQHQVPMYQALASSCKTIVILGGGSHCQFAEPNFFCELGEAGCATPAITREEQHALTATLLVPWLGYWLWGDAAAWIEFQNLLAAGSGIESMQECDLVAVDERANSPPVDRAPASTSSPEPFLSRTSIRLDLPERRFVELDIYDPSGRRVKNLVRDDLRAGVHELVWDGTDAAGSRLPAGVYLYQLRTGRDRQVSKLTLIR